MKNTTELLLFFRLKVILCFVFGACLIAWNVGCRHEIPLPHKDQHPHMELYKQGLQSYRNGKYEQSGKEFKRLLKETNDPVLERKTKFALACSALAGAQSTQELAAGMRLWEEWSLDAPENFLYENPHLVYPILKDYYLHRSTAQKAKEEEEAQQKTQQAEVKSLQKKVDKLRQDNRRLLKQLKALEKLYQELQQRRQNL
jgi:TolA-binding protein